MSNSDKMLSNFLRRNDPLSYAVPPLQQQSNKLKQITKQLRRANQSVIRKHQELKKLENKKKQLRLKQRKQARQEFVSKFRQMHIQPSIVNQSNVKSRNVNIAELELFQQPGPRSQPKKVFMPKTQKRRRKN